MADTKVEDMTADTDPGNDSLLYSVDDPAGTPVDRQSTVQVVNRGLILLDSQTASNSASLDFTSLESASYDEWILEIISILAATDTAALNMRMSTDGGSSYDSGTNYGYAGLQYRVGYDANWGDDDGATEIAFTGGCSNVAAEGGVCGNVRLFNFASTTHYKFVQSEIAMINATPYVFLYKMTGVYKSATAVNAFQLLMSSGNITSGTARLYGMRK